MAFVFGGLAWLLWVFLIVAALLVLPVETEDDTRFLTVMYVGFASLIAVGAVMGWRRGGRL